MKRIAFGCIELSIHFIQPQFVNPSKIKQNINQAMKRKGVNYQLQVKYAPILDLI